MWKPWCPGGSKDELTVPALQPRVQQLTAVAHEHCAASEVAEHPSSCSSRQVALRPRYQGSVRRPRCANPTRSAGPARQICRSLRGAAVTLRLGEFTTNSNNSPRRLVP
eukprot:scaffold6700_cov36-Phaeocystis_antarctica.AAC.1